MESKAKQCNCTNCPCRMQTTYLPNESVGAIVKQKPEITFNTNRTRKDGKKAPDGIEIRFGEAKPVLEVRELLKASGFRFSEHQKIWYARDNAKARELAESFANSEVEVDDTKYEKLNFWAKVKSFEEYGKLRPYTEFMIAGQPPQFYRNKGALEKGNSVQALIKSRMLSFKKHWNKPVGEEKEPSVPKDAPEESGSENTANKALAQRLKDLADAMQPQIDAKLNSATSKQRPTAKRLRVAAGMREDGYKLQDTQTMLYALSNAHSTGMIHNFEYLSKIRNKTQIELITYYGNAVKHNWGDAAIQSHFDRNKESYEKLGIKSVFQLGLADLQKGMLLDKYSPTETQKQRENEQKIKQLEMQIFSAQIPGFFPTPIDLIERLIELAEIEEGEHILEPSAGKGDILDAIKVNFEDTVHVEAAEINYKLRELLSLKGYELVATNFLEYNPEKKYDKIIMNPPFENGQDIEHVEHALELLKPNGRLVAIMGEGFYFRQFKKDQAFKKLLLSKNAYVSDSIKEGFKNGFKSTGVAVRIVAINKNGTRVSIGERSEREESGEDQSLLELEAEAELELLKMRVENERKRKKSLNGLPRLDPVKLNYFRKKAKRLRVR